MSGLFAALNIARSGMDANSKSMSVVGNNIANLNTPGYSRQAAEARSLPSLESGGLMFGQGVSIERISRAQDVFVHDRLLDAEEEMGRYSAMSAPLQELEQVFGVETGDNLAGHIEEFFVSWDNLATNPGGEVERAQVIQMGHNLVSSFDSVFRNLDMLDGNISQSLSFEVGQVNAMLKEVAELNTRIARSKSPGGEAHSAMDRRDLLLRELSGKLGTGTYKGENDMVSVVLPGGRILVQGEGAHQLKEKEGSLYLVSGQSESEIGSNDLGGAFGGLLEVRDGIIHQVRDEVLALRNALRDEVNEQHKNGYYLDGEDVKSGENFFTYDPEKPYDEMKVALSNPSEVAAAGNTEAAPGDNENALKMYALSGKKIEIKIGEEEKLEGSFTLLDYYGKISAHVGMEVNQNKMRLESSGDNLNQLINRRESRVGVSLQESMLELTMYQRGFQAAARHMSSVDEMLQTLMGVGR